MTEEQFRQHVLSVIGDQSDPHPPRHPLHLVDAAPSAAAVASPMIGRDVNIQLTVGMGFVVAMGLGSLAALALTSGGGRER